MTFIGISRIFRNTGENGGGINSKNSIITLAGEQAVFDANTAENGGAINLLQGEVTFYTNVHFTDNVAGSNGGAIYSLGATVAFKENVGFASNSAENGGAMFFINAAVMILTSDIHITTSNNTATQYGGAIHYEDSPTSVQCEYRDGLYTTRDQTLSLLTCFLQISNEDKNYGKINSYANSAGKDGSFLYSGLLDKCRSNEDYDSPLSLYNQFKIYILDKVELPPNNTVATISSKAYGLYFCYSMLICTILPPDTLTLKYFEVKNFLCPFWPFAKGILLLQHKLLP